MVDNINPIPSLVEQMKDEVNNPAFSLGIRQSSSLEKMVELAESVSQHCEKMISDKSLLKKEEIPTINKSDTSNVWKFVDNEVYQLRGRRHSTDDSSLAEMYKAANKLISTFGKTQSISNIIKGGPEKPGNRDIKIGDGPNY